MTPIASLEPAHVQLDLLSSRGIEQMRNPQRRAEILRTARVIYAR